MINNKIKIIGGINLADEIDLEQILEIVQREVQRRGFGNDPVHGWRHIIAVINWAEKLMKYSNLPNELVEDITIAAIAHDVGRDCPGLAHALASAEWLENEKEIKISPERRADVVWAVSFHSTGLAKAGVSKAVKRKHIIAGFLVLADHLDALGYPGAWRLIESQRHKKERMGIYSSNISVLELREIWHGGIITAEIEGMNLKNDSVIAHMIYNYLATAQIVGHIKHLLSREAGAIVEIMLLETATIIESMLSFQKNISK